MTDDELGWALDSAVANAQREVNMLKAVIHARPTVARAGSVSYDGETNA